MELQDQGAAQVILPIMKLATMPMDVAMRVVWDAIRSQLQAVVAGQVEPAGAAKIMQSDAVAKLKEMR